MFRWYADDLGIAGSRFPIVLVNDVKIQKLRKLETFRQGPWDPNFSVSGELQLLARIVLIDRETRCSYWKIINHRAANRRLVLRAGLWVWPINFFILFFFCGKIPDAPLLHLRGFHGKKDNAGTSRELLRLHLCIKMEISRHSDSPRPDSSAAAHKKRRER